MQNQAPSSERDAGSRLPFDPEMKLIPAGKFVIGENSEQIPLIESSLADDASFERAYGGGWQSPQHTLHLPNYHIATTPVTMAQYAVFLQDTGHARPKRWRSAKAPRGRENFPVTYVSWHDAVDYCRWLSECTAKPYRLPTEAEWEKAARGIDGRIYPWGNKWQNGLGNTTEAELKGVTAVDAFLPGDSPYGTLGMAGNVWEWTVSLWGADWYEASFAYPYDPSDGRENLETSDRVCRVLRGGSWAYSRYFARCAYRYKNFPQSVSDGIGFRVACSGS